MDEWFHHYLKETGHRPVSEFYPIRERTLLDDLLTGLRRKWEVLYPVSINYWPDGWKRSEAVSDLLLEGDHKFSPWTSVRAGREIVFIFRDARDAAMFRLLLPD